ncbi:aldo/keto reductase [Streptomyces sp. NPDC047009]|uniref:aldo/keto reductase n=3 Tax=unclassified Streptomyces TaxID=2593676 RepID=UPI0033EDB23D
MSVKPIGTRALGSQGLHASVLGLGCMGMSAMYGGTTEKEARSVIHRALDLGVNMLDTSDAYGPYTNEELVGRAIAGRRDEVVISTKFGAAIPGVSQAHGDPDSVRRSCDASLRRLGVDYIDLYYQHRVDFTVPVEETFGAMAELVHAGKVRYLGISEASAERIRRAHSVHPLTAVQSEYSLWSRDLETTILPTLRELGIGLVPYSPLGRGFLTGTITSTGDLADNDVRKARLPRFQDENLARNLGLLESVKAIAQRLDATPGQVALAWVLAQGDDVVPIPGTRRVGYLEENLAATRLTLADADLRELESAFPPGVAAGERYDTAAAGFIES